MPRPPELPCPPAPVSHPRGTRTALAGLALVASLATALLTGCSPTDPDPSSSPTAPEPTTTTTPTAPAGPVLVPEGSASDNLPLFTAITGAVWATEERVSGRAYVDALTAAGFDKAAMQVTPDQSTVGNAAESILFSVMWGQECLIGQVGPATGEPVTIIVPVLAEGTCLVGSTRPIDW